MARKIIDLSIAIENDVISDPPPMRPQVQYFAHAQTAGQMATYFPCLTSTALPDGEGWAVEQINWEGHRAGRDIGYCHLEKLHNLKALPAHGFEIICRPVKIKAESAGWAWAVALIDE